MVSIKKIKLIITADDYGMSSLFNKGILELAHKHIISSVSVMIKRSFINPADFKKLPNVSVGLHLELREEDFLKEMEKQLALFINIFHRLPSHLDGHNHCHLTEANLPKVIELAKKHNLPARSRFTEDRIKIRESGVRTPDNFVSWHPHRINRLSEKFERINGVTELVCHPGYYDKDCDYPYNKEREEELGFMQSNDFKKILNTFELVNYNNFLKKF